MTVIVLSVEPSRVKENIEKCYKTIRANVERPYGSHRLSSRRKMLIRIIELNFVYIKFLDFRSFVNIVSGKSSVSQNTIKNDLKAICSSGRFDIRYFQQDEYHKRLSIVERKEYLDSLV